MKSSYTSIFLLLFAFQSFEGCYYDNEEDLYPVDPSLICDIIDVSYQNTVKPILENHCVGCHTGNFPSGNVLLDNHQSVADVGKNGKLFGVINHENGFSAMPPSGVKIDQCEIDQIEAWINDGARDN